MVILNINTKLYGTLVLVVKWITEFMTTDEDDRRLCATMLNNHVDLRLRLFNSTLLKIGTDTVHSKNNKDRFINFGIFVNTNKIYTNY